MNLGGKHAVRVLASWSVFGGKLKLNNVVFIAQVYGGHNNGAELARAAAGYGAQN
jgi:hypothetical protein